MLPDFDRGDAIGSYWGNPKTRTFAKLLIDGEQNGRSERCSSGVAVRGREALIDLRLPYRPQANGKVERFNVTLRDARPYEYNSSRADVLERGLHDSDYHRLHMGACGQATDLGRKQLPEQHH
jgi:transposase InsO family protein